MNAQVPIAKHSPKTCNPFPPRERISPNSGKAVHSPTGRGQNRAITESDIWSALLTHFSDRTWLFSPNSPKEITDLRLHSFAGAIFKAFFGAHVAKFTSAKMSQNCQAKVSFPVFMTLLPSSFSNISCYSFHNAALG